MIHETFKTQREFNNKFPTKIYKCPKCGHPSTNPYFCIYCKNQANNFIYEGYKYTINETGITEIIFQPIELTNKESEEKENE